MDEWLDDTSYDVIVVGTGLTESITAAALARSGRKVLHLDALPFYGEPYATHSLPALRDWLSRLACDGASVGGSGSGSEDDAVAAPIDVAAVEQARRVAEWQEPEVDKLGRPVVHDGLTRGRSPRVMAERANPSPRLYRRVAFEQALPPLAPPAHTAPASTAVSAHDMCDSGEEGVASDCQTRAEEAGVVASETLVAGNAGYRFNIDVAPKIHLSLGPLIKALLKSGVGRYLEFMPLRHTFLYDDGHSQLGHGATQASLQRVPMSKADIFQAKSITPIEKRLFMKFMQWCIVQGGIAAASEGGWAIEGIGGSETEQLGFQRAVGHVGRLSRDPAPASSSHDSRDPLAALRHKTLGQVMDEHKLTGRLQRFVKYGIVMGESETSAEDAINAINVYAQSLGRYSESAFLCTYYGTAEIPQAFCRMCAVYGGTYVLRRAPAYFLFSPEEHGGVAGIICSRGQILRAPVVVCSRAYSGLPTEVLTPPAAASASRGGGGKETAEACPARAGEIQRCVCVASGPLVDSDGLCLAILPPGACGNRVAIRILQLDFTAQACPRGAYVWHLWTAEPSKDDLRPALSLLRSLAPAVALLFTAFYSQACSGAGAGAQQVGKGLWLVDGPSAQVDSADGVVAAHKLFLDIAGEGAEFLEAMAEPQDSGDDVEHLIDLLQPNDSATDWSPREAAVGPQVVVGVDIQVDAAGRAALSLRCVSTRSHGQSLKG